MVTGRIFERRISGPIGKPHRQRQQPVRSLARVCLAATTSLCEVFLPSSEKRWRAGRAREMKRNVSLCVGERLQPPPPLLLISRRPARTHTLVRLGWTRTGCHVSFFWKASNSLGCRRVREYSHSNGVRRCPFALASACSATDSIQSPLRTTVPPARLS